MRLDAYLHLHAMAQSRNKAQELIKEGLVLVNGAVAKKSSLDVSEEDSIKLLEHRSYVSRAAWKLRNFLDDLELNLQGKRALDIGSSTGGFTQVLLEEGVASVDAVDVGSHQLHESIKKESRVTSYENCDIRTFEVQECYDLVVSDVSFISLHHILDAIDSMACGIIILLFKPQFEVGREAKRDKNGVVLDAKAILHAMESFEMACREKAWQLVVKEPSKITGKEGNLEYCYYFTKC
jgi:23S rRNA (cytidine1920-2'-O)/16S rRNA (cytidine1409-2'-O)-methyltransferase